MNDCGKLPNWSLVTSPALTILPFVLFGLFYTASKVPYFFNFLFLK